ncbi:tyrosine-type recombinase/integrase [Streptomyces sp. NBC_01262]|uniref:tyrosine-type recombinase/integrase n=1 Tax=Streptomyces sp. NBC_01262 TaxID=2903803 RepID=UPI002E318E02|nr:tyrosine-type recombinase/integrase [Streptomyces sp. NBC_01262]
MSEASYFRRCQCKAPATDDSGEPIFNDDGSAKLRDIGLTCPDLKRKGHGTWYFSIDLEPGENGKRRRIKRGGFVTKEEAKAEAKKVARDSDRGTDVLSNATVGEDLKAWLKRKKALARTTRHSYEEHVANYLAPHLGHLKRRDLKLRHIETMFDAIEKENAERLLHHALVVELQNACATAYTTWVRAAGKKEERRLTRRAWLDANAALKAGRKGMRKITSAATMHRINATLSSFLNTGIKRGEYTINWTQMVELPAAKRPKPLVWTPERVEEWKRTGDKPGPVMVWTPEQTGQFLDFVSDDRLYPLWHTFTFLGPRRGEMCALPWQEVSLTSTWMRISAQIVEVAYRLYGEDPKADSVRTISISAESVEVLRAWRLAQVREHEQWSGQDAWVESDRVFTQENGEPYHPDWISRRFKRLVELSGLPPVRLHDLRHISATLSLLAKNDIKVVQERLGHSSRQITSDTYTSVLPQLMRAEAESTLSVVPRETALAYEVVRPLAIPARIFTHGMAVLFVHGASNGGLWTIGLRARSKGAVLGEIRATLRTPEQAAAATEKWLQEYCASTGFKVVHVENWNDRLPEEQRSHAILSRVVIDRASGPSAAGWVAPQPPAPDSSGQADSADRPPEKAA